METEQEVETIEETIKENYSTWAIVLEAFIKNFGYTHHTVKQDGIKGNFDTKYGRVAKIAEQHLPNANLEELKMVFKEFFDGLINTMYQGNRKMGLDDRPSDLWEKFAFHYLTYIYSWDRETSIQCTGGKDDYGVDLKIFQKGELFAVVQVKRGKFFQGGKGPRIIRELFGSMGIFNTKYGCIFTNEESKFVKKKAVLDHIRCYEDNSHFVECICVEDIFNQIMQTANTDIECFRNFFMRFLQDGNLLDTIIATVDNAVTKAKSQETPKCECQCYCRPYLSQQS